jgi:hypothetical protein
MALLFFFHIADDSNASLFQENFRYHNIGDFINPGDPSKQKTVT